MTHITKKYQRVILTKSICLSYTLKTVLVGMAATTLLLFGCDDITEMPPVEKLDGELAGGATTVFFNNSQAFGTPATNLSGERMDKHLDGDVAFEVTFVSHPAGIHGGLGPVFNNSSCIACHPQDGRAAPPISMNEEGGFFLRVSIPGVGENNGPNPVPGFGTQLQHHALYNYEKEASIAVHYEKVKRIFADGTTVVLQKPVFSIENPYIPLPANLLLSPRIGMPVFGLGLLEAITEYDILDLADETDVDDDGISGKPNYVWDPVSSSVKLGRFGWKAGTPSVLVQSAGAYNQDMGITNSIMPNESSFGQSNSETDFNDLELSDKDLENVTFYVQTLGVPAGRSLDAPDVIKGYKIFEQINCSACHTPSFTTGVLEGVPEVSLQKIFPYTDMLLHDLGDGLADNRSEFEANGKEWKTRPLWGIGLTSVVNGHTNFLHDGRARNITEAILWHGGEAEQARNDFMELKKEEREALLLFINSI